jgi:protoporphyrinogen/coproporphyrinogen III oxidase
VVGYTEKVVVIGAGISGLACAYRLKQLGIPCLVLEAKERPGGLFTTTRRDGFVFEGGPQCPRFPAPVWQLVRELNLESEFVYGDPKAKRYILRHGALHPAPFSLAAFAATRLVGVRSKLRVLTEAFHSSRPPEREESLAEFVQRKFGVEMLDNLVDPFISTIFFGDARRMGMQSAFPALVEWERNSGSLMRGAIRGRMSKRNEQNSNGSRASQKEEGSTLHVTDALPALGSFQTGMARLPEKIAEELGGDVRYRAEIRALEAQRSDNGMAKSGWEISMTNGERIAAEHVVVATPANVAAELLHKSRPELSSLLTAIEYAPMTAVSLAYERSQVANSLDGFGFMIPRKEEKRTICTFWNSSLFPQRAPGGKVLITSFVGNREGSGGELSEEECVNAVKSENAAVLGIHGEPVDGMVWKDEQALPQYNVGHAQRVGQIEEALRRSPNLQIAGNFLKGRSIGDCVEIAFRVAENLHGRIRGNV